MTNFRLTGSQFSGSYLRVFTVVKFKPKTLGFKKYTAFSFLPSCARIKSPARRQFNTDRMGAGPRIWIRRSSLEGVQQFSSVYLHFINRKQGLSFSSSSAGTELHGDFGSHPHPSLQARRQKRAGPVRSGVTAFWASPRFGHPHSQIPSVLGIPFSYYCSVLGIPRYPPAIAKSLVFWSSPPKRC